MINYKKSNIAIACVLSIATAFAPLSYSYAGLVYKKAIKQLTVTNSGGSNGGGSNSGGDNSGGNTGTPAGSLSSSSISFSNSVVGDAPTTKSVTFINSGTADLVFTSTPTLKTGSSTSFSNVQSSCSTTLAPGASCSIFVSFSASQTNLVSGLIEFSTNAGNYTISLSGTGAQAQGSLSASAISFGSANVGSHQESFVLLQNSGNAPLVLNTAPSLVSGANVGFGIASATTCNPAVAVSPGASCKIYASFDPVSTVQVSGSISVQTAVGNYTIALSGYGSQALAQISTTAVNFGGIVLGTSQSADIEIQNTGNSPLTLPSLPVLTAGSNTAFSASTSCVAGASIQPGASCFVTVVFSPVVKTAVSGGVDIHTSAGDFTVSLAGSGTQAHNSLSTSNIDFAGVSVNTSQQASVVLQNDGDAPLVLTAIPALDTGSSTSFSVTTTSCNTATALQPGSTCSITATFTPSDNQNAAGSIAIQTNVGNLSVGLSGHGTSAVGALNPASGSSADFGTISVGTSASKSFDFTNNGNISATSVIASLATTTGTGLSITSNTCGNVTTPGTLAANATCSITVTYAPTAIETIQSQLQISSSAINGLASISLTGSAAIAQLSATGGTVYTPGDGYKYHVFSSVGSYNFVVTSNPSSVVADVLVVAGGGGGGKGKTGSFNPGGGGAGGVISSTFTPTAQTYALSVGAGGAAETSGSNSTFSTLTAIGGGFGAGNASGTPATGGSGGGALGSGTAGTAKAGAAGTSGQGHNGGTGYGTGYGGGGGGAGANGGNGDYQTALIGGAGGAGVCITKFVISAEGLDGCYGGGGAGGSNNTQVAGGIGGGGSSSKGSTIAAGAGTAKKGGGGGAGSATGSTNGGAGGSGIVIVRYPLNN